MKHHKFNFAVGEIVKVRSDLEINKRYEGIQFIDSMAPTRGRRVKILSHSLICGVSIYEINSNKFNYTEEMFEKVKGKCKGDLQEVIIGDSQRLSSSDERKYIVSVIRAYLYIVNPHSPPLLTVKQIDDVIERLHTKT